MKHPQLLLKNQLCHRLYQASNRIVRSYRPHLTQLGLTYPQYVVMMALWEEDNVVVKDILERTTIDAGALSLILQKLSEKQLINVVAGEEDKRQKVIKLTLSGKEMSEHAAAIPAQMRCTFSDLSDDEVKQLTALLDKLNSLNEGCANND
ncbi:MarR family winged helix-turn-helix transcriptional regulator [Pseudoalteromonas xiamenensis]